MKTCPKCGEQIKDTLKFCVYCGCNIAQEEAKSKAKFCGECGAQIEDGMKFCGECGAKIDAPAKQNDDPWADVFDEQKSDDPWANFADSEQQEEEIEQEPQVDLQKINDDYNKGMDLYWTQQYSDALPLLLPAAQQGNGDAQFRVGYCYLCLQKDDEAYQWFCKASAQGISLAYSNIGWMYQNGRGIKQDYALAYSNFKTAAEMGDAWAQNSVGWCYHQGLGVQKDYLKAIEWYQKAISNGEKQYAPTNLYNLAKFLPYGGNNDAEKKKGFEVLLSMAQDGNVSAQKEVGDCYYFGTGTTRSNQKAAEYYLLAMQAGNKESGERLCSIATNWIQMTSSTDLLEKAFDLLTIAAKAGYTEGYDGLGYCYLKGKGTKKDLEKAKESWKMAPNESLSKIYRKDLEKEYKR